MIWLFNNHRYPIIMVIWLSSNIQSVWYSHDIPMVFPWYSHGIPHDFPIFHRYPRDIPREFHFIPRRIRPWKRPRRPHEWRRGANGFFLVGGKPWELRNIWRYYFFSHHKYLWLYIYNLHYIEISIIYPTFCFACKWGYWVFMGI